MKTATLCTMVVLGSLLASPPASALANGGSPACTAAVKASTPTPANGCPATCVKLCCAASNAPRVNLGAAMKAIHAAEHALEDGKTQAAMAALALARRHVGAASNPKPINTACPMTNRPVQAGAHREHAGKVIAFCGPGCASAWDGANEKTRKDVFGKIVRSVRASAGAKGRTSPKATCCGTCGGAKAPARENKALACCGTCGGAKAPARAKKVLACCGTCGGAKK